MLRWASRATAWASRVTRRAPRIALDHLDGDRPLQPLVPGAVDGAEAAAADRGLDRGTCPGSLTDHRGSSSPPDDFFLWDGFAIRSPPQGGRPGGGYMRRPPCSYSGPVWHSSTRKSDLVVADEPERPRRRVGGPQRRRQQFLVRRLIGVGVGLGFLILIVIGIRGCLEARSDRGLRNYTSGRRHDHAAVRAARQGLLRPAGQLRWLELARRQEPGPGPARQLRDAARPGARDRRPGPDGRCPERRHPHPDAASRRPQHDRGERPAGDGATPRPAMRSRRSATRWAPSMRAT